MYRVEGIRLNEIDTKMNNNSNPSFLFSELYKNRFFSGLMSRATNELSTSCK